MELSGNDRLEDRHGNEILRNWVVRWEADGTGSGLCPMMDFGVSSVEASGSDIGELAP